MVIDDYEYIAKRLKEIQEKEDPKNIAAEQQKLQQQYDDDVFMFHGYYDGMMEAIEDLYCC